MAWAKKNAHLKCVHWVLKKNRWDLCGCLLYVCHSAELLQKQNAQVVESTFLNAGVINPQLSIIPHRLGKENIVNRTLHIEHIFSNVVAQPFWRNNSEIQLKKLWIAVKKKGIASQCFTFVHFVMLQLHPKWIQLFFYPKFQTQHLALTT